MFDSRLLRLAKLGIAALLAALSFSPATAQLLGPEFQVNSYTTGYQGDTDVAADGAGNFVVVWTSVGEDGYGRGIFGQRYQASGSPAGTEFQVNTFTTGRQSSPSIALRPSGGFVVVWYGTGAGDLEYGVFGRRFDASGVPVGSDFRINSYATGRQGESGVAADGLGNYIVVWRSMDQDGSGTGIFAQRFNSAGGALGGEFQVNTYTTGYQVSPAVAADVAGNFLVVWTSISLDISHAPVLGQRYNLAGSPQGAEFQINEVTSDFSAEPSVAADGTGNFVVVWGHQSADYAVSYEVFGRRVDASGVPVGQEFHVNTFTSSFQRHAKVAADAQGDFVVTWNSNFNQDGSFAAIVARRFSAEGVPASGEFLVNSYTTGNQYRPAVAAGAGDFVVTWMSESQDGNNTGVFAQRLAPPLFGDGFESADACAWSAAVGGACP